MCRREEKGERKKEKRKEKRGKEGKDYEPKFDYFCIYFIQSNSSFWTLSRPRRAQSRSWACSAPCLLRYWTFGAASSRSAPNPTPQSIVPWPSTTPLAIVAVYLVIRKARRHVSALQSDAHLPSGAVMRSARGVARAVAQLNTGRTVRRGETLAAPSGAATHVALAVAPSNDRLL